MDEVPGGYWFLLNNITFPAETRRNTWQCAPIFLEHAGGQSLVTYVSINR